MPFKYDFTKIKSEGQLIHFLGLEKETFASVLAFDPKAQTASESDSDGDGSPIWLGHFIRHDIPKKNPRRGSRVVWEPTLLKNTYKALGRQLGDFFAHTLHGFPHARTFGYIGGRNIRENARDHCGHKYLISVDLDNFFPSIDVAWIAEFLNSTGMEPDVASLLGRFVTIDGALPLGLPTSPTIANAICLPLDRELEGLVQNRSATFSRYADDISFSGDGSLPSIADITDCIRRHGFKIAESKTRASKLGQAHYVTGLSVSDPQQPHVPRRKKRRLRQELYYAEKFGLDSHFQALSIDAQYFQMEINRLDGLVKFVAFHEPRRSGYLKTKWARILEESGDRPSFAPKSQLSLPFFIHVDESEFLRPDGSRMLALAMAVSQHQDRVNEAARAVLDATLSDVWADGNRDALSTRGLHFSDATQDLRLAYVERMRTLPFEGYVAMGNLPNAAEYERTYIRLLNSMIVRRLMAAESQFAYVVFEQNDKVSQESVRRSVMDAFEALSQANNRRPNGCHVKFSGKLNPALSVPDFLLGVLGKYLALQPEAEGKPPARERLLFERIRDKYRLIFDLESRIEYSRRRPISPWRQTLASS